MKRLRTKSYSQNDNQDENKNNCKFNESGDEENIHKIICSLKKDFIVMCDSKKEFSLNLDLERIKMFDENMSSKLSQNIVYCKICKNGFRTEELLNEHMDAHRSKKYDCSKCGQQFAKLSEVAMHMHMHLHREKWNNNVLKYKRKSDEIIKEKSIPINDELRKEEKSNSFTNESIKEEKAVSVKNEPLFQNSNNGPAFQHLFEPTISRTRSPNKSKISKKIKSKKNKTFIQPLRDGKGSIKLIKLDKEDSKKCNKKIVKSGENTVKLINEEKDISFTDEFLVQNNNNGPALQHLFEATTSRTRGPKKIKKTKKYNSKKTETSKRPLSSADERINLFNLVKKGSEKSDTNVIESEKRTDEVINEEKVLFYSDELFKQNSNNGPEFQHIFEEPLARTRGVSKKICELLNTENSKLPSSQADESKNLIKLDKVNNKKSKKKDINPEKSLIKIKKGKFECRWCNFTCDVYKSLLQHRHTHSKDSSYKLQSDLKQK